MRTALSDRHLELLRRACTHYLAQEGFEHEQRPQRGTMIARTRLMRFDHLAQECGVEVSGVKQYRPEYCLLHPLPQRSAEPARERHRKAHLRPVQDLVRKVGFERLLEQVLAFAPLQLEAG